MQTVYTWSQWKEIITDISFETVHVSIKYSQYSRVFAGKKIFYSSSSLFNQPRDCFLINFRMENRTE